MVGRQHVALLLLCTSVGSLESAELAPARTQTRGVFRTATRLVTQIVTVKDKQGRPVEGLSPADFLVTEDGRPQDVVFAEFQRLKTAIDESQVPPAVSTVPPALTGPAPASIAIPAPGDIRYRDRRLLILYFDLTWMPLSDQNRAYKGALKYIDARMTPSDLLAIMMYNGGAVRVRQDFTDDRAALREALQRLFSGDDLNGDGLPDEAERGSAFGENDAEFNLFNTDRQLAALQTAVAMLQPLSEQKSLVYFGSGFRLNGTSNRAQLRATINAAVRANVALSPVDARGLVALAPIGDATRASPGGVGMFSGALAEAATARFQRSQDALYSLAKETGGDVTLDQNDLSVGIATAARAVTSYYILGYYSTQAEPDGRFRRVRVALRSGTAAELSYRGGYFAEKVFAKFTAAERERQLAEALKLEDPITEIHIAAELNYFRLTRAEYFVPVSVRMPGGELALARRRGAARTRIDMIGEVKDDHGVTHRNVRDRLDIRLDDGTAALFSSRPVHYETGFTLLPGRYVIKFLARDATTGRIGTFETPLDIPNLDREHRRLPISSVVLSGQRVRPGDALYRVRQKNAAEASNPLLHGGYTLIPSVTRVFRADRELHVLLYAYPHRRRTSEVSLVAFAALYREDSKVLETPVLAARAQPDSPDSMPLWFSIPLQSVPVGAYDFQVTVLDPDDGKAAFWRAPIALVR